MLVSDLRVLVLTVVLVLFNQMFTWIGMKGEFQKLSRQSTTLYLDELLFKTQLNIKYNLMVGLIRFWSYSIKPALLKNKDFKPIN